jgi:hypothetical protein
MVPLTIPPEIVMYGFAVIVIYKGYFVKQLETVLLVDYYFFIKTFTLSNLTSTLSQFSKIPSYVKLKSIADIFLNASFVSNSGRRLSASGGKPLFVGSNPTRATKKHFYDYR